MYEDIIQKFCEGDVLHKNDFFKINKSITKSEKISISCSFSPIKNESNLGEILKSSLINSIKDQINYTLQKCILEKLDTDNTEYLDLRIDKRRDKLISFIGLKEHQLGKNIISSGRISTLFTESEIFSYNRGSHSYIQKIGSILGFTLWIDNSQKWDGIAYTGNELIFYDNIVVNIDINPRIEEEGITSFLVAECSLGIYVENTKKLVLIESDYSPYYPDFLNYNRNKKIECIIS